MRNGKWAKDFISWCDENEIEVPRTQEGLLELEVFEAKGKSLTSIHPNIVYLKKLYRVVLENNALKDIPKLPSGVLTLILKNNLFTEVPENVREIKGLLNLVMDNNMIEEIPSWIGELKVLLTFSASFNRIKTLEPIKHHQGVRFLHIEANEIRDISPIYEMKNLQHFHFQNNNVTTFDKRIRNLKKLEIFSGMENPIKDFDMVFLARNKNVQIYLELIGKTKIRIYRLLKFFMDTKSDIENLWRRGAIQEVEGV